MLAEIVSVGNELMDGFTVDTHAATMSGILAECGVDCNHRQTVRDNWDDMIAALREAFSRSDLVITIGGLGPTGDDLTKEAVAHALGDMLVMDEELDARLHQFFIDRKMKYADSQKKQAMKPTHGQLIENPNGTAPGVLFEKDGKAAICLPGPRGEFVPMAKGFVRDYLIAHSRGGVIVSRTLRLCGIGESQAELQIKDLMYADNPRVAPYAQVGEVHLRVTAHSATKEEGTLLVEDMERKIRAILGVHVYGIDDTTLEAAVIDILKKRNETVAVAESITGGELGARFTSVSGSGDAFLGGVISYDEKVKQQLLGVAHETLEKFGPVSEQTAREMAEGVRANLGATYGISLTGNAGPTSDKDKKPVGLVYIAVAGPMGTECTENKFHGLREDVRKRSTQSALVLLRTILLRG